MSNGKVGRILVVDDEVELKNILVESLAAQGFDAAGFTSGAEALEALRDQAFDILLTDLMMPEMDGISLMRAGLDIDPHLICIVMTGHGTIQTAVDAMKIGAFDYVLKPFRLKTVLPVLTRAINARHLRLENLQLRETVAIYELAQTIAFTLDPQTIISKLADAALQQTDADEVSVLLPTEDPNEMYVAAVRGENRQRLLGERVPLDESISGWVAQAREPLMLEGEIDDERFRSLWPHPEIRSAVLVPMQVASQLVGTININSLKRARAFTLGQMKGLTILASTAAAALQSASLYKQVRDAEESYRTIFENAIEGIFRSTRDGRFITVNPALARILGYDSPSDLLAQVTDIATQIYVDPENRRSSEEIETSDGVLRGFEFEAYRKDGSKIWLSLNRRSIRDENGVILFHEGSVEDVTERRRAEEALRASQQLIEEIINAIPVRVFWKDKDLAYLGCNAMFARDAGLARPDEIVGKNDYQLSWSDQADLYRADDREVIETGRPKLLIEEPSTSPDGKQITLLTSKIPLCDPAGEVSGVLGTYIDITERKQAEVQRDRLAALVEASPDFIGYADPETQLIQYINKHGRIMCGIGETEELGSIKIGDLHPAWMNQLIDDVILPAAIKDGLWVGEGAFLHRSGREIPVLMALMARTTASGDVDIFYTVSRDITERKRDEEALRKSEERYRDLVENAHDIIYAHDLQGNYTASNRASEEITGYSHEESLKLNFTQTIAPEYLAKAKEMIARKLAGEKTTAYEIEVLTKDGGRVPLEVNTRVVYEDGVAVGVTGIARDIRERKAAEADLALFRRLIDQSNDGIYIVDPITSKLLDVNQTVCRQLGYSRDELRQLTVSDISLELATLELWERHRTQLEASGSLVMEFTGKRKDGTTFPVEVSLRYVTQHDAQYVLAVTRDITERKRTEAELLFQKSLLESQTEASVDGVLVVSPRREILSFNQRFLDLWGIERERLKGSNRHALQGVASQLASPEEFVARVNYLYEHPGEKSQEEIQLKDGRTFDRYSAPVKGPHGEDYGRVWFFRDVTERRTSQAELTKLAAAVEQTADSILITGTDGQIEYVNPAFERVTGYTRDEALGQNPRMLKSGRTPADVYRDLWETITRGEVWVGQLENRKKDGTLFNERATISAIHDEAGKIVNYLAVKQDITREIALEDQLRQSQKMEAIGQLAGGVAHDFNNLLTAINGYSALALQRVDENHPLKGFLEEIKKAGDRAANLTRQLLAFGRKQILQPVALNLNDIVNDLNKMLRRLIGEDIELVSSLDPNLRRIKADPGQIEQVLVNLVVNARDAMPQGGNLTIETRSVELDLEYASKRVGVLPGAYVMLAVSDTGIGMDEQTRARIFDPFFTTKPKGKGTGLGLSTVYGIVKQSGGNIWVYSEPGQGTTFKIYLPQIESAAAIAEKPVAETAIPAGSETVLLVEDEDSVRSLTRQILQQAGYKVIEASRGEDAIRLCSEAGGAIELLLTDVVMPQMSGKEVADRLTADCPKLKVLFMSGYTDEAIVHHGVVDSNIEFIQKPFTPAALAGKIRRILDTRTNGGGRRHKK